MESPLILSGTKECTLTFAAPMLRGGGIFTPASRGAKQWFTCNDSSLEDSSTCSLPVPQAIKLFDELAASPRHSIRYQLQPGGKDVWEIHEVRPRFSVSQLRPSLNAANLTHCATFLSLQVTSSCSPTTRFCMPGQRLLMTPR